MKREIKFRAWDKRHNQFCTDFGMMQCPDGSFYIDYVRGNKFEHHVNNNENVEIMQFTGLKDKNGREIYEGDILKYDDINWGYGGDYDKENDGYLRVTVPPIDEVLKDDNIEWFRLVFYEVIGNIYENPELLNK